MSEIRFTIPSAADSAFLFRRAFLGAIRKAIGDAQIRGEIDAELAVECCKALPPATAPNKAA
jgi:hypothetical protein